MATVTEDLVSGHVLVDVNGGSTITRVFHVTGLVAAPHGQLLEALRDPGIPDIGDIYPNEAALTAQRHEVRPAGVNGAIIEVLYGVANRPRGGTWNQPIPLPGNDGQDVKQVSSTLREIITHFDVNSNRMILTPPPSKSNGLSFISKAKRFVPVANIVFERTETTAQNARIRSHFGRINSLAVGSFGVRTLLFHAYDSVSPDGGRSWQTTYEFTYDGDGWDHEDIWRDENGRPPADASFQSWQIMKQSDFNALGLDFSDVQVPV